MFKDNLLTLNHCSTLRNVSRSWLNIVLSVQDSFDIILLTASCNAGGIVSDFSRNVPKPAILLGSTNIYWVRHPKRLFSTLRTSRPLWAILRLLINRTREVLHNMCRSVYSCMNISYVIWYIGIAGSWYFHVESIRWNTEKTLTNSQTWEESSHMWPQWSMCTCGCVLAKHIAWYRTTWVTLTH